jgi:ParB/RepB/Spo0J family partition protein
MQVIARELIHPNEWNANAFDPENYPKLVESIRQKGFMEPLKVTVDPAREGHYLLVDGYHRWKAAGELGIRDLPCEVWDISPEEAKVRGLQLNYLRGQPVPDRLARLIHDLSREMSLNDLAGMLPWSEAQLRDSLELLRLPADLQQQVEQQAADQAAQAPIPVTVVMLPQEYKTFEEAMARARAELGRSARRSHLWAHICHQYLNTRPRYPEAVTPVPAATASRPTAAGETSDSRG